MDQGIGREVKRLREERGWGQARLAVEAKMSVSGVSQIENGKRNLSTATLAKLAEAFGVEVADLFPKAQGSLFTQPPSEEVGEWEGPIPNSLGEALEWAESPTRLLSSSREELEELYADLAREEVIDLNRKLTRERELLKPLLHGWRAMPSSEEKSRLIELWKESLVLQLTGAAAAARTGDMETAQELSPVA
ncbi:MAG: helix-turn-helix transcriptional regulator [Actinobacteria bacterium]|nr:helix-turn-helix transcriptional regulator [Actinomycetota bacterium]